MLIEGDEGCHSAKTIERSTVNGGADTTSESSEPCEDSDSSSPSAGTKSTSQEEPSANSTGVIKRRQSYKPSASPHWAAAKRLVEMYVTLLEGQFTSHSLPNRQRLDTAQRSCVKILDRKESTPEELEALIKYAVVDMEPWANGPYAVSNFFGFARRWHEFKLKQEFPEKLAREMQAKRLNMAENLRKEDSNHG